MLRTIPMTTWAESGGGGTGSERQENKTRRSAHVDEARGIGLWRKAGQGDQTQRGVGAEGQRDSSHLPLPRQLFNKLFLLPNPSAIETPILRPARLGTGTGRGRGSHRRG